ncbi:MAG: VOC family protein [Candidatus Sumerlaeaceae bacterium]
MEPRISIITLGVSDLDRSFRFYRDGLGFPTTGSPDKGIVFFQTSGACLALYPYEELAKDIAPDFPRDPSRFNGITIAHNVRRREEVDAALEQARLAGAKIEKSAQDTFWGGYSGYLSDPDGYLWEIAWGAFPFREDGSLEIP